MVGRFAYLPSLHEKDVVPAEEERLAKPWVAPIVSYPFGDHHNPVTVAQFGLGDYTRYLSTGDERLLGSAANAADWLLEKQGPDGAWRVDFAWDDLPKGWTSAMYQGQAISLLCRIHAETGEAKYLDAARKAHGYMMLPMPKGTLGAYGDGGAVLEEYPGSTVTPHVLNGTLFALWGVRDLAVATGDRALDGQWRELASVVAAHLPAYDTGAWSAYSVTNPPMPAPVAYHGIHIAQLRVMAAMTGDRRWAEQAEDWAADLEDWSGRD